MRGGSWLDSHELVSKMFTLRVRKFNNNNSLLGRIWGLDVGNLNSFRVLESTNLSTHTATGDLGLHRPAIGITRPVCDTIGHPSILVTKNAWIFSLLFALDYEIG